MCALKVIEKDLPGIQKVEDRELCKIQAGMSG
jgi:hypothetical protein